MQLIHNLGKKSINKTVDDIGSKSLMLARDGSYLWVGNQPASRYQGWFFGFDGNKLLKIVESIRVAESGSVAAFENNLWNVKMTGNDFVRSFFLSAGDCLVYEIDKPARIEFFLDIKESYKNPESGRYYEVGQEDDMVFIRYRQDSDFLLPEIFVAVCGDISGVEIKQEWTEHNYEFDRGRGSAPCSRWVFMPAAITASKLVFAIGFDKNEALFKARQYWRNFEKIKRESQEDQEKIKTDKTENGIVKICAQNALRMLFAKKSDSVGVRAGLPWFFQFWQRDEAVSLKGLSQFDQKTAAKIFWRQLAELRAGDFHSDTADGIGWLFLRASDFYRSGKFNVKETAIIRESLENSIKYLLESNTRRGLAVNGRGQTWMDSLDRSGACIEIQALRLNMYSLAADLAIDQKQAKYYRELEENLKNNVRILFFDGNNLIDRFDTDNDQADYAIRPNIFLAAYIYPDLLSKKEWAIVFESALAKLWLDWGGLATLDKTDARFCVHDTGENPTAYHNGDSWFWVNNIAAIVMARTDKKRFKNYIDKIFEASKNDILWNGALGSASEISSAEIYASVGCANQAWSNATFLELCQELIK